jgi:hypothetical protein
MVASFSSTAAGFLAQFIHASIPALAFRVWYLPFAGEHKQIFLSMGSSLGERRFMSKTFAVMVCALCG